MRNLVEGSEVTVYFSGVPTTVGDAGLANAIRAGAIGADSAYNPFTGMNPKQYDGTYALGFRRPGWFRILNPNAPFESPWPRTYFLASDRAYLTDSATYPLDTLKSVVVWGGGNNEVNWIQSGSAGAHIAGKDNLLDKLIMGSIVAGAIAVTGGAVGLWGTGETAVVAAETAFVGPVETPLLIGPVETVLAPAAVADVAPFVGPLEVATTTPGWTLAETIAATKAAGTTALEGAKVVNQVAGAIGAGAAVVAAIKGPQEQPTQSPAEKIGATFSGFTDQLASVNKNVWYAVGGIAVLLAMG